MKWPCMFLLLFILPVVSAAGLGVSPYHVHYELGKGETATRQVVVHNAAAGPLHFRASVDAGWIQLSETEGRIESGEMRRLYVTARLQEPGSHTAAISIRAKNQGDGVRLQMGAVVRVIAVVTGEETASPLVGSVISASIAGIGLGAYSLQRRSRR